VREAFHPLGHYFDSSGKHINLPSPLKEDAKFQAQHYEVGFATTIGCEGVAH